MKSGTFPRAALVSLGCPKNLVDSEVALGLLQQAGFTITLDESEADVLIVNTCSFIEDAKQESIETILELAEEKRTGSARLLVVAGCLAQNFGDELRREIPEIDLVIGTGMVPRIGQICKKVLERKKTDRELTQTGWPDLPVQSVWVNEPGFLYTEKTPRIRATLPHVAYVKIAEGCNNRCSYCIIPRLRGKLRSRTAESIVAECRELARQGVKEITLIAQDTTAYGQDLPSSQDKLVPVLRKLAKLESLHWIRLLYTYPDSITPELLTCIAEEPRICKYIDMPVQHINDGILQAMNRRSSRKKIEAALDLIREILPDAVLRTSLMVGFPGEGKREFEELRDFVAAAQFDRLGVFSFSAQEETPAARLAGKVSQKVKEQRQNEILQLQADISTRKNHQLIGTSQEVIIDLIEHEGGNSAGCTALGRTSGHAPDIDGLVYVQGEGDALCFPGQILPVRIVRAGTYDLFAERLNID
ncbi:MAG: 30S ribosomal protein S12 methylthiotransferase RimO [bacterium]